MESASSCSSTSTPKDSTDSREEAKKAVKKLELCPFKLLWSFGMNPEVPVINLTTKNRTIIAYACSHIVMLYNYEMKKEIALQGHEHAVKTLSTSKDGKWLLSADFENDHVVVVWDTETGVPVCTLFNPHAEHFITAVKISPNAKYIVTVGNERFQKVQFWLWTYGKDEPHGSLELTETPVDRMKEISFNEDLSEEFVLTGESNVVFITWEDSELKCHYPQMVGQTRRYGILNASCIVPNIQRAYTVTSNGYVLVWQGISEKERNKSKEKMAHIKSMQLQKCSLNVILHYHGLITVGTAQGRINFYDLQLKLIYWIQNFGVNSIHSISFKLPSTLLGPTNAMRTCDTASYDSDDFGFEEEGEEEEDEKQIETEICQEKLEHLKMIETQTVSYDDDASSTITINLEYMFRDYENNEKPFIQPRHVALDATFENAPFYVDSFFVSSSTGAIALVDIPTLKCRFVLPDVGLSITSLDAHPRSHCVVTGNAHGMLSLYQYEKRKLIVRRNTPPLPDFHHILEKQVKTGNITYVTCPQTRDKLTSISVLKYSPLGDQLACGLDNGTLWILDPLTLEPLHDIPYKHSSESIIKLVFTECAEYMAYFDNKLVVAVFKKSYDTFVPHPWDFLGKYRTHLATITDILFGPATSNSVTPRLFSLGEDRRLVEYDLKNSGPYPDPGLMISEIYQIEHSAVPFCLAWYPIFGVEQFLVISNSEYKYRLLNDVTKMIRGTFLGPIFGAPVQRCEVLSSREYKSNRYIIFATDKEIGLQIIPLDGNPYKTLGMIGHPRKITNIRVNCEGNICFTSGYKDPCVLMWEIKCRSVDVLELLGGQGLSPYYCLLEGGRKGWLVNEMKDFFYYAQILHQGENTPAVRIVTEKVNTKQIPNLMRAIGFYPTNEDIEILMNEVSYRKYAETGKITEEITFEDYVKYYINHRPAFGISLHQLQETFQTFVNPVRDPILDEENPVLTRNQFLNVLFGKGPVESPQPRSKDFGEPLIPQEAYMYLKLLIGCDDNEGKTHHQNKDKRSALQKLTFLPERISYKDFITDIMGIELPEETRADDE